MKLKKFAALGLAMIAPFSLSGCLILPGEFTSEMTVMKSGEFTFSYKGQIQLLGLASMLNDSLDSVGAGAEFEASCWGPAPGNDKAEEVSKDEAKKEKSEAKKEKALAQSRKNQASLEKIKMSGSPTAASATAVEEYDDPVVEEKTDKAEAATGEANDKTATEAAAAAAGAEEVSEVSVEEVDEFGERECTAEEVAEQKAEWEETQATQKKMKEEQKKIFSMLLAGVDPEDPKTIERFAKEVERLAAWNKVEHLGDGLFMIDYSSKGQLADDFAFPVIPRYAIGQPMVHITRWDNGRVRVEAPSFHTDPDFSLMAMIGSSTAVGLASGGKAPKVKPVEMKGTFTLTTDARILANNTEDGPEETGKMSKLTWNVGPEIFGPPMALLKLN